MGALNTPTVFSEKLSIPTNGSATKPWPIAQKITTTEQNLMLLQSLKTQITDILKKGTRNKLTFLKIASSLKILLTNIDKSLQLYKKAKQTNDPASFEEFNKSVSDITKSKEYKSLKNINLKKKQKKSHHNHKKNANALQSNSLINKTKVKKRLGKDALESTFNQSGNKILEIQNNCNAPSIPCCPNIMAAAS